MRILAESEVGRWRDECRSQGLRVGYTCGAFDILHAGHVDYLAKARMACDRLLVAVNSDLSIQSYKSPARPFNPEQQRMKVVSALRSVDVVTLLPHVRPVEQLQLWRPDYYIKGGDYEESKLKSATVVNEYGGSVVLIPIEHSTSTTLLSEKILAAAIHESGEPASRQSRGIVFLDRDGTLIGDPGFLHDAKLVELLPGVGEGLAHLQKLGFRLVIITNQQGIGLGYYSAREFIEVNQALFKLLNPFGVKIDRVLFCPHSIAENCDCRKPGAQLLRNAFERFHETPEAAFLIGDRESDIEAARAVGCRSVLLGKGQPTAASFQAPLFQDAVSWIEKQCS